MAQNGHRRIVPLDAFIRCERPTDGGVDAEHGEVVSRDEPGLLALRGPAGAEAHRLAGHR